MRPLASGRRARVPLGAGIPVIGLAIAYGVFALVTGTFSLATAAGASGACAYAVAGTLAWLRRRDYWTGPLMIVAGYLTLVGPLQRFTDNGALFAIGNTMNGLQQAALAYLLLTYPSGKPVRGPAGTWTRSSLSSPASSSAFWLLPSSPLSPGVTSAFVARRGGRSLQSFSPGCWPR